MRGLVWIRCVTGLFLLGLAAACTRTHYEKAANDAAYGVVQSKSPLVQNMDPHFTIEQTNALTLQGLPLSTNGGAFLGTDGERERGGAVLNLEQALNLSVKSSRAYQSRKEQLYLSALALTLARHQ